MSERKDSIRPRIWGDDPGSESWLSKDPISGPHRLLLPRLWEASLSNPFEISLFDHHRKSFSLLFADRCFQTFYTSIRGPSQLYT